MAWSKVNNPGEVPIGWWYHKLLCELGYWLHVKTSQIRFMEMYHHHLNKMVAEYKYNLYGEKMK